MSLLTCKCPHCGTISRAESEQQHVVACICTRAFNPAENRALPAHEWDAILKTNIVDWDGFPNRNASALVTEEEFRQGAMRCTQGIAVPKAATEQAATGAVRSQLYPKGARFAVRFDLMLRNEPGLRRLAETWGEGFEKYSRDNWMKGFPESVLIGHAFEHLLKYANGNKDEDDIAHAIWNLMALCWIQENKPELLDLTGPEAPKPQPSI